MNSALQALPRQVTPAESSTLRVEPLRRLTDSGCSQVAAHEMLARPQPRGDGPPEVIRAVEALVREGLGARLGLQAPPLSVRLRFARD